jgi:ribose 5-phosphate isomerase A
MIHGEAMAQRAAELVQPGMAVGLGTGHAASAFLVALADRVRRGLDVRCVATSAATESAARDLGLPLVSLEEVEGLDLDVDGADEIDPALDLVKGYGGALVRERIVAAASRRLVILAGAEKLVARLGERGVLPVEVVPFGWAWCSRRLAELGCPSRRRVKGGATFITDNGNTILDCDVAPIADPAALERRIRAIPGVVGTGLFLGMADTVLIEDERGNVTLRQRV